MLEDHQITPAPPGTDLASFDPETETTSNGLEWVAEKEIKLQNGQVVLGTILSFHCQFRAVVARQGLTADEINKIGSVARSARLEMISLHSISTILKNTEALRETMYQLIPKVDLSSVDADLLDTKRVIETLISNYGATLARLQATIATKELALTTLTGELRALGVHYCIDRNRCNELITTY